MKITLHFNSPPQARAYRSYAPSLEHINLILSPIRDLVRMSASCSLELANSKIFGQQYLFNKMTIKLYIFNSLKKDRIGDNIKSFPVVTIQLHLFIFTKFQFLKELFNPHKFACS